jgi:hypothetical protein
VKEKKKPIVPPVLKDGHQMTEKKLAGMRRKDKSIEFLLRYPLDFFMQNSDCEDAVDDDVKARACPPGYIAFETDLTPYAVNERKREIDLRVVTWVEKAPEEPAEAEPAPPAGLTGSSGGFDDRPPGEFRDTSAEEAADASRQASEYAAGELERKKAGEEKAEYVPVKATVHSDDREATATFDAAPWFEQATEDDILNLAREEYKYEATSDRVAEFMAARLGEVKEVMDYVGERNTRLKADGKEEEGFGCAVTEDDVLEWVEANRPYLLPKLAEIKEGKDEMEPVTTANMPE